MTNREKEDLFFTALITETPIEISVRLCAQELANIHYSATSNLKGGTIPESDEQSVARHFISLVRHMNQFKSELKKLDYMEVPSRLFVKLGPAIEWTLKDVRGYLDIDSPVNDPIENVREAFQRVKDICRSESQPEDLDAKKFVELVDERMDALLLTMRELGKVTRAVEERRVIDNDRARGCAETKNHLLPHGKGVSHFDRIGIEYKGVLVPDPTHIVLYKRVALEITAQGSWNIIDRMLGCHFNDEPFELKKSDIDKLTTPDERRLVKFIHRETLEEAGRHRRGNGKYTGLAWFTDNAAA